MPRSAAPMAYSPIRPKSQIYNVEHDGTLSIRNFILMVNKLKNHKSQKSLLAHIGHHPTKFPNFKSRAWWLGRLVFEIRKNWLGLGA
jgi:hypothetical protein